MKRAFVRGLWGYFDRSDRILKRKGRVDGNIKYLMGCKYNEPFITYVWGDSNYKILKDLGVKDLILVTKEPQQWDLVEFQYRHKLQLLKLAMEDFDQIVHMDWDVIPTKQLPIDFWETLEKKEPFQACLAQYKKIKCGWRKEDPRKVANGGWVYIREKQIPDEIITTWEQDWNTIKRSCEPAMSKWIDNQNGKWIGVEEYYKRYEPEACSLSRNSPHKIIKDSCFLHFAGVGAITKGMVNAIHPHFMG